MGRRGRPSKASKEQEAYISAVQGSFKAYCMHVHNLDFMNNPDAREEDIKWKPSRFHQSLCDTVQSFVERPTDRAYEILIISTPPQHGKSVTITETFPSWYIMKHPDNSVIEVSYGDELAERFGKRNLEKVKEFGNIFGVSVDPKKATSKDFEILNHRGRMISRGVKSPLTGFSGHLIVIDDPVKNREQADSEKQRDSLWNEFMDSIVTRSQAGTKIILIMTRWHEDDLAGRILKQMPDVTTYINYECECETDRDPLHRRRATDERQGAPLCPEIGKGETWLEQFKKTYISENGRRSWEALYQGHPTIQEGNLLKKDWWVRYKADDYVQGRIKFERMTCSVDAAFKDGDENDYVCIGVWGKIENRFYLVDLVNEHLDFSNTLRKIRMITAKYPRINQTFIEDKANGTAIINVLQHEIPGIIGVTPQGSKESRVSAVSYVIEMGNVYIPDDRIWGDKFIEQCAKFPNDKHDDMVDMMSQALSKMLYAKRGGVLERIEEATGWKLPSKQPRRLDVGSRIRAI